MAKIKMAHIIAEARGAVGGTVFSRNTYGAYIRTKISPVQPRTVAQSLVRTLLTTVSQAWRGLTELQRTAWITVSENFSNIDVFGDNVPLTGFGLFSRLNRNRQTIGEALISDPPLQEAVIGFDSLGLTVDNSAPLTDDKIELDFSPPIPAAQRAVLYCTPPLSPGKNFVKSEYRLVDILTTADVSPFAIGLAYEAVFGLVPPIGSKAFAKVRPIVTASGLSGTELQASNIAL